MENDKLNFSTDKNLNKLFALTLQLNYTLVITYLQFFKLWQKKV